MKSGLSLSFLPMLLCLSVRCFEAFQPQTQPKSSLSCEANALCDGLILVPSNVTCHVVIVIKYSIVTTETILLN